MMEAFRSNGVVSDVIDETPATVLQVSWMGEQLYPGDVRTPTQVKDTPTITFNAEEAQFYTLLCNDPDAPSRADPKFGQFQHWLVTNIPGNDVSKGDELTAYIGSGAPKGTGLHRYVFLLYKQQDGKTDFSQLQRIPNTTANGRRLQNAKDFACKYRLQLVAGNFYLAEWDEYVPSVHEQLGLGKI